jgi:hypothetical protein
MWFFSWLTNRNPSRAGTRARTAGAPRKRPSCRPRLETLEDRYLLSFGAPATYRVPGETLGVVTADVSGDGKPDLIAVNTQYIIVWQGIGGGRFAKPTYSFLPQQGTDTRTAFTVADINGDGKADIVVANDPNDGAFYGEKPSLSVFLNNGNGTFQNALTSYVLPNDADSLAVADFNGDRMPDIAAVSRDGTVSVALNSGGGYFNVAQTYGFGFFSPGGSTPYKVAVGDFNGDGFPDLVATATDYTGQGSVNVLLNNPVNPGTFGPAQTYDLGGPPTSVAVGDFNGDGKSDLVATAADSAGHATVNVLLNKGDGSGAFGAAQTYALGGTATSVAVGDFNHDGKLDIVTTGAEMDVLLNNGDGTFGPAQKVGPAGSSVVVGDFNGDGFPDLAQFDGSGIYIDVLINKADWKRKK